MFQPQLFLQRAVQYVLFESYRKQQNALLSSSVKTCYVPVTATNANVNATPTINDVPTRTDDGLQPTNANDGRSRHAANDNAIAAFLRTTTANAKTAKHDVLVNRTSNVCSTCYANVTKLR